MRPEDCEYDDYSDFDGGEVREKHSTLWASLSCVFLAFICAVGVFLCDRNLGAVKHLYDCTSSCYMSASDHAKSAAMFAIQCKDIENGLRRDCRYVTIVAHGNGQSVTQKVETVRGTIHFTFKDGTLACSVE